MAKSTRRHEDEPEDDAPIPGGSEGNTGQVALDPEDLLTTQEKVARDEEKAAAKAAKAEEKAEKKGK